MRLYEAFSNPRAAIKEKITETCHNRYQMTLVCECCLKPQFNSLFPLTITQPKEFGALLAYAMMTLAVVKGLNLIAQIAQMFYPVVPALSSDAMQQATDFVSGLGQGTLDGAEALEKRVEVAMADKGSAVSAADSDSCKRQIEGFLAKMDPDRNFAGLNRIMGAHVYFVSFSDESVR